LNQPCLTPREQLENRQSQDGIGGRGGIQRSGGQRDAQDKQLIDDEISTERQAIWEKRQRERREEELKLVKMINVDQSVEDWISTERNNIWDKEQRDRREKEITELEEAMSSHPDEVARVLIAHRDEIFRNAALEARFIGLEADEKALQASLLIREEEKVIMDDIDLAVRKYPVRVAKSIMRYRRDIPFEIDLLVEGRFVSRLNNSGDEQLIADEISTEQDRQANWEKRQRERREKELS
jgi:hypothetical protein